MKKRILAVFIYLPILLSTTSPCMAEMGIRQVGDIIINYIYPARPQIIFMDWTYLSLEQFENTTTKSIAAVFTEDLASPDTYITHLFDCEDIARHAAATFIDMIANNYLPCENMAHGVPVGILGFRHPTGWGHMINILIYDKQIILYDFGCNHMTSLTEIRNKLGCEVDLIIF